MWRRYITCVYICCKRKCLSYQHFIIHVTLNCIHQYGDVLNIYFFFLINFDNLQVRVLSASLDSSVAENMACIKTSRLFDILTRLSFNSIEDSSWFGGTAEYVVSLIITGLSSWSAFDVAASVFAWNKKNTLWENLEAEQCREHTCLYFSITKLGIWIICQTCPHVKQGCRITVHRWPSQCVSTSKLVE